MASVGSFNSKLLQDSVESAVCEKYEHILPMVGGPLRDCLIHSEILKYLLNSTPEQLADTSAEQLVDRLRSSVVILDVLVP